MSSNCRCWHRNVLPFMKYNHKQCDCAKFCQTANVLFILICCMWQIILMYLIFPWAPWSMPSCVSSNSDIKFNMYVCVTAFSMEMSNGLLPFYYHHPLCLLPLIFLLLPLHPPPPFSCSLSPSLSHCSALDASCSEPAQTCCESSEVPCE